MVCKIRKKNKIQYPQNDYRSNLIAIRAGDSN